MKNFFKINRALVAKKRLVMLIMAVALAALPAMAQDWQSTSTMQGSGSAYSPQVTAVGATEVTSEATTTESYSPAQGPNRARRGLIGGPEDGTGPSPVGSEWTLLLYAAIAAIVIAVRNHVKKSKEQQS